MRSNEHPPPHFHVFYGEFSASIEIESLILGKGDLPPRIRRMVVAWAQLRQNELRIAWRQIQSGQMPDKIAPPD